jgi:hypothetical protein
VAPDRGVDRDPRGGVVGRWVLVEALVSRPDQFAGDASVAPGRILRCQAQHQLTDLVAEGRTADRCG